MEQAQLTKVANEVNKDAVEMMHWILYRNAVTMTYVDLNIPVGKN